MGIRPRSLALTNRKIWQQQFVFCGLYGLLFFVFFELGSSFAWVNEGSLWYPPAGLRWALLLTFGGRFLPAIVVAEVLAIASFGFFHPETHYYDSWWVLMVAFTPLLYGASTWVFVRSTSWKAGLRRTRDIVWLCIGMVVVPLAAVVAGRIVYCAVGLTAWNALLVTTFSFWIGDMIGILMITPLLLIWLRQASPLWLFGKTPRPSVDAAELLTWKRGVIDFSAVWLSMLLMRFFPLWFGSSVDHLYWYLLFLPLIWISFRRGLTGSVVGTFAVCSGAAWFVLPPITSTRLFDLHVLILTLCLATLLMGAAVSSQRDARRALRRRNLKLRRIKSQLEIRNQELESRRLEISAFLRSLSHELRNPLVTLGAYVGRLETTLAKTSMPGVGQDLDAILNATRSLDRSLEAFEEFSRATRAPVQADLDLGAIARKAIDQLASEVSATGARVEIEPDLPTISGDHDLMLRVFQHLVDNALKFSSHVSVPLIEIGWKRRRTEHVLFVRDNGRGIDHRYLEKIFEVFGQLDFGSQGTGIGLAVVRRIIEDHGGRIWAESAGKDQGATFMFTLPSRESIA